MTARLGSMFTGVGGLDLAVTAFFDADTVWHCEDDPHAGRVLATRFPGIPNLGDVTAIDWATVPPVDVLCGGFPCQDISFAGLGGGITEGSRSGLWSSMATAVRILRPRVAVLENVSAITVRGLDRVAADLASVGYDLAWTCVRAADVGAPHRRSRWFAVAYADRPRSQRPQPTGRHDLSAWGRQRLTADADCPAGRRPRRAGEAVHEPGTVERPGRCGAVDWGPFGPAVRRWERILGRPAPQPADTVRGRLNPDFVEWLMGLDVGWTDVGISRAQRLKCLGNAVVPQQARAALGLLLDESWGVAA